MKHNKSLNATPMLCVQLSPGSAYTVRAATFWARVNSMFYPLRKGAATVGTVYDVFELGLDHMPSMM